MIENKDIKISFDFDGTLTKPSIQSYAKLLVDLGYDVYVVTARFCNEQAPNPTWNIDLFDLIKDIGIKESNIIFMNMVNKSEFFIENDFLWHLDDDFLEIGNIEHEYSNNRTKTLAINCFANSKWIDKCNELINNYKNNGNQ